MKQSFKALFRFKDDEFKAYQIAQEIEEAASVAKETVHKTTSKPVHKVKQSKSKANPPKSSCTKGQGHTSGEAGSSTFQGILWQVWEEEPC